MNMNTMYRSVRRNFAALCLAAVALLTSADMLPSETETTIDALRANTIDDFDFGLPNLQGLGRADASLVLLEFSDYECDFCATFHEIVFPKIKSEFIDTGKLYYVALNHPQAGHASAQIAAEASYCAGLQGRYWEMRELLFANYPYLNSRTIRDLAAALELDMAAFDEAMLSGRFREQIEAEKESGAQSGVVVTPSFILATKDGNRARAGQLLEGGRLWSNIKRAITKRLKLEADKAESP